jgi:arabinoxylan arabinofuranohydrolase
VRLLVSIVMLCALVTAPATSRADNPIVQTNYTADPAAMVYNGTLYVYTGHDEDVTVNNFFTMNNWLVFSTTDMVNWTDHGSPMSYQTFSWARGDAWAAQPIFRGGKFYYYAPVTATATGARSIGVAVSNSPTGPFVDAIGKPLITSDCGDIDPTVFIDDDSQAYLYWGNPSSCYVKLNADMISFTGGINHVPMTTASFGTRTGNAQRATLYEEGPWFYKRNGLYYLAFAADCCGPEKIDYSTSPGPTGPWTYKGRIYTSAGSASFTNQTGIFDFMGHSYALYHNGALPGGGGYHRSVGIEEFKYNADGTIPAINPTALGPAAIATLNPFMQTEAETIAFSVGLKTEVCSEGGMDVTSINNGDYIKVRNVDFGSGITSFDARVASAANGGTIELHLDSLAGPLLGVCAVQGTGGAQTWVTKSCLASGATGVHDLFLRFTGSGTGNLFSFNWWKFSGPGGAADGGGTGETDGGRMGSGGTGAGGSGAGGTGAGGSGGAGRAAGGTGGGVAGMSGTGGTGGIGGVNAGSGGAGALGSSGGRGGSGASAAGNAGGCNCQSGPGRGGGAFGISLLLLAYRFRRRRRAPVLEERGRPVL